MADGVTETPYRAPCCVTYRGLPPSVPALAETSAATGAWMVEGSVLQAGDRLQVAQLIDVRTDAHSWQRTTCATSGAGERDRPAHCIWIRQQLGKGQFASSDAPSLLLRQSCANTCAVGSS